MIKVCRLCDSTTNKRTFLAQEKMFGNISQEVFEYFECGSCGTIQISEIPADLERYYPENYYSLSRTKAARLPTTLRKIKYRILSPFTVPARSVMGKALGMKEFYNWLGRAGVKPSAAILDFGSGAGHLLLEMFESGFENLTGIDPYLEKDIVYNDHVRVLREPPSDAAGKFDVVMSHHSFEHVLNPKQVFSQLVNMVKPGGVLILRIPFLGWAWQHFGLNWVGFDAPRHLFHYSETAIKNLAQMNSVKIETQFYDSFEMQYWASLQYEKGIFLLDAKSYGQNPIHSIFSKNEIKKFNQESQRLNKMGQGDQVCYIIRK